jgi:hypothetical protein
MSKQNDLHLVLKPCTRLQRSLYSVPCTSHRYNQVLDLRTDLGMVAKIYLGVEGGARDLTLKCYDKDGKYWL